MILSNSVFPNLGRCGRKPDSGRKEQALRVVVGGTAKEGIGEFLEGV